MYPESTVFTFMSHHTYCAARQTAAIWYRLASLTLQVNVLLLTNLFLTYQCYTPLFFDSADRATHTELHCTTGSHAQVKQPR